MSCRAYQYWLDRSTPHPIPRWVLLLVVVAIYGIRVYLLQVQLRESCLVHPVWGTDCFVAHTAAHLTAASSATILAACCSTCRACCGTFAAAMKTFPQPAELSCPCGSQA